MEYMPRTHFESEPSIEVEGVPSDQLTIPQIFALIALEQASAPQPRNIDTPHYVVDPNGPLPYEAALYLHRTSRIRGMQPARPPLSVGSRRS